MRYLMALCCVIGLAWPVGTFAQAQTPRDYNCNLLHSEKHPELTGAKQEYAKTLFQQCEQAKKEEITSPDYTAILSLYQKSIKWYQNKHGSEEDLKTVFDETLQINGQNIDLSNLERHKKDIQSDAFQSVSTNEHRDSVLNLLASKLKTLQDQEVKRIFNNAFFEPYYMGDLKSYFNAATTQESSKVHPSIQPSESAKIDLEKAPERKQPNKRSIMDWLQWFGQLLPWLLLLLIQAVLIMGLWRQKQHLDTQSEKIRQLKKQVDTFTFQLSVLGKTPLNEYIAEKFKAFYQQKIKGLQSDIDNLQYRSSRPQQESQSANPPHEAAQAFSFSEQAFSHPVVFTAEDWLHSYQHNTAQAIQAEEVIKLRSSDHNQRARRQSAGMVALQECSSGQFYFAYPDSESSYWVVPSMDKAWLPNIQDLQGLQDLYLVNEVPDTQRKRAQIIQILQPARMHKDPGGHWTLISQGQLQLSSGA